MRKNYSVDLVSSSLTFFELYFSLEDVHPRSISARLVPRMKNRQEPTFETSILYPGFWSSSSSSSSSMTLFAIESINSFEKVGKSKRVRISFHSFSEIHLRWKLFDERKIIKENNKNIVPEPRNREKMIGYCGRWFFNGVPVARVFKVCTRHPASIHYSYSPVYSTIHSNTYNMTTIHTIIHSNSTI